MIIELPPGEAVFCNHKFKFEDGYEMYDFEAEAWVPPIRHGDLALPRFYNLPEAGSDPYEVLTPLDEAELRVIAFMYRSNGFFAAIRLIAREQPKGSEEKPISHRSLEDRLKSPLV